jgi:hypothetical protein
LSCHDEHPGGVQHQGPQQDGAQLADSVPIEDSLDLHTFRPAEVKDLLADYLDAAGSKGFREVRVIHGKGQGILRRRVHAILAAHPEVIGFKDAEPQWGGWGATVVQLADQDSLDPPRSGESTQKTGTGRPHEADDDAASEGQSHGWLLRHNGLRLLVALILGLGLGSLFHQVLVGFGAQRMPAIIALYGLCTCYWLIRKATSLFEVVRRAAIAALVLAGLWVATRLLP